MTRIRSVFASLTGAAIAATLAFGISSAAAQPAASAASRDECSTGPSPTPFRPCGCADGSTGYCSVNLGQGCICSN